MAKKRLISFLVIMALVVVGGSIANVGAISAPDVVVSSVYWGTNPLGGVSVHPGDTNIPLSIVLSNAGDATARQVSAELILASPFSYVYYQGGSERSVTTIGQSAGDLPNGFSFTLRFILTVASDAVAGVHRLDLMVRYKTATELLPVEKKLTVDVPVWTGNIHVQHVLTVPSKVYPGDNQIVVKTWLVNSGTGSTADLQVRLMLRDPFRTSSGGSDEFFVGTMQPGQISEADFYVDIVESAEFGSYSLELVMDAPESTGQVEIGEVPIYVSEKVNFDIIQAQPTMVRAGDSGVNMAITVKNVGSVTAESVRIQLRVGNYFSGTLTDFLGTMQPGETKTAFLTVDVDSKAQPQKYRMDVRLDWTQLNNSLDETLTLELETKAAEIPVPLVTVAAVLIVVVAVVALRRRIRPRSRT